MLKLILSSLLLLTQVAFADWHVIDLNELNLDYRNYAWVNSNSRNLLIYPEAPKEAINVNLNFDMIAGFGYWNSSIESLTTSAQYRAIGLQTAFGVHVSDFLDVGYWHHSQHVLDEQIQTIPKFPSEDAVEIKIYIFRKTNPNGNSIF